MDNFGLTKKTLKLKFSVNQLDSVTCFVRTLLRLVHRDFNLTNPALFKRNHCCYYPSDKNLLQLKENHF